MSEFKFLIDTNIVIGLEDNKPIAKSFSEFSRRCAESGITLYVHQANYDDVSRDPDVLRRKVTLSKLDKFAKLAAVPTRYLDELIARLAISPSPNDEVDLRLLAALHAGAVDFLVSEDLKLHKFAGRVGLSSKIMIVTEAVEWLRQTYEPKYVSLPFIVPKKAYELDRGDPIFESIRGDYPEFDDWFDKCVKQHRDCWVVEVQKKLAGLIIRKDETHSEAKTKNFAPKILKICTFKLEDEFRGQKFGEQLLKQVLWFAQRNSYGLVYLTALPKQLHLIALLEYFGFEATQTNSRGEIYFERVVLHGDLPANQGLSPLDFCKKYYPRFVDAAHVGKYYIPIRPEYHSKLFPEISYGTDLPLLPREKFGDAVAYGSVDGRIPGNSIRKVYLCHAPTKSLRAGDILLFYMSKSNSLAHSQSITTLGVIERIGAAESVQKLVSLTAKRSVFSEVELSVMLGEPSRPLTVIDFLLAGHSDPPIGLNQLRCDGVIKSQPPQSISEIPHVVYLRLRKRLRLGYEL